jgi:hypothetical protein
MATERINDLLAFKGFIEEKLSNGRVDLTLDEALVDWGIENQTDEEREDTLRAIRAGLADVEAGRVMPARNAVTELRRKHNLPELR